MRPVLAALALLVASSALAQAESYQPVRVDVTVSGAYQGGDVPAYGFGAAIEPKFNLTDRISIGARFEGAGLFPKSISVGQDSVSMGVRVFSAYLAKADLYLTTSSTRPFVGIGAGLYRMGAIDQSTTGTGDVVQRIEAVDAFGFCPQLGVNFGGFRLAAVYHVLTGGDQIVVTQAVGQAPVEQKIAKSFFVFELGGTFGGRRRTPAP